MGRETARQLERLQTDIQIESGQTELKDGQTEGHPASKKEKKLNTQRTWKLVIGETMTEKNKKKLRLVEEEGEKVRRG